MIATTQGAFRAVRDVITSGNAWTAMDTLRAMRCCRAAGEDRGVFGQFVAGPPRGM